MAKADDIVWFEFIESKTFHKQVRDLHAEVLTNIQIDLVQNAERGPIVKGTHGVRKARVADPASTRGKSGSYRYLYSLPFTRWQNSLALPIQQSEQADLSPEQERIIAALSQEI